MEEIKVRGWKNGRRRRNTRRFTASPTLEPESNAKVNWSLKTQFFWDMMLRH